MAGIRRIRFRIGGAKSRVQRVWGIETDKKADVREQMSDDGYQKSDYRFCKFGSRKFETKRTAEK